MPRNSVSCISTGIRPLAPVLLLGLIACSGERESLSPLPLERGAVVSGAVLSAGDRPQQGAVVSLERLKDGLPAAVRHALLAPAAVPLEADVRVTTTDRAGRFIFADLAAGDYLLEARAGHHRSAGRNVRIAPNLTPSMAETTFVDIALQPTGTFSGSATLWAAANHQSTIVYVTGTSVVAVTDAAGSYLLRDVPIGAHTVIAAHESWLDATVGGSLAFAGDSVALAPMVLNRTWNILPTVSASAPASGEVGVAMNFQCTAADPDGAIALYEWDFNDDGVVDYSSALTGNTTHSPAIETTRAKVRVTDDRGAIAIAVVNFVIYDGVYVATTGSDANSGLRTAPKATPAAAVAVAQGLTLAANRRVFLAQGIYLGPPGTDLVLGTVNMSGGHSPVTWLRTSGQQSIITLFPGMNLQKDGSSSPTWLTGLDVRQTATNDKPCVLLNGTSTLVISECRFEAAPAPAGTNGGVGTPGTSGIAGAVGQPGSSNSSAGGAGGNGTSPGGIGGQGGYDGPGGSGQNSPDGMAGGSGGAASSACNITAQGGGNGGNGTAGGSGSNGAAAMAGLQVAGSTILVGNGTTGTSGTPGKSGGGGGGGGGGLGSFPCSADRGGGGGEGGGGGGLGSAGGGGQRGGCSVALLLLASAGVSVNIDNCALVTGIAGNGGNGGDGAAGGTFGSGGNGGAGAGDSGPGGRGGNGGTGGSGGGGSGGAGGWCVGLIVKGAGTHVFNGTTITLGTAGSGGTGGRLGGTGALAPSGPAGSATQTVLVP